MQIRCEEQSACVETSALGLGLRQLAGQTGGNGRSGGAQNKEVLEGGIVIKRRHLDK